MGRDFVLEVASSSIEKIRVKVAKVSRSNNLLLGEIGC